MRGRKPEPDGKRVTICAKFSEGEAAEIEAARGAVNRSEWVRTALLVAARPDTVPAAVFVAAGDGQPQQAESEECPHPKARVIKGFCGACGTRP